MSYELTTQSESEQKVTVIGAQHISEVVSNLINTKVTGKKIAQSSFTAHTICLFGLLLLFI